MCKRQKEAQFRWLELPLDNWECKEILEFLEDYCGVENLDAVRLSERIFNASSSGIPTVVRRALEEEFIFNNSMYSGDNRYDSI